MKMGAHEGFIDHGPVALPGDRKFGLTVGGIFLALAGVRWLIGHVGPVTIGFAAVGALLLLLGALAPGVLGPANRGWMKLGGLMAAIVNPIVMLLMFGLVFTPVAVAMRLRRRDGLGLRRKPAGESYWHDHDPQDPAAERLKRQF